MIILPDFVNSIGVIVPSLKRPAFLRECLSALSTQSVLPTRIYVGIKVWDEETWAVVQSFASRLPVTGVEARGVGVVGAMSSCLEAANEQIVALLDDDAYPRPNWIARILTAFQASSVLGIGGLDLQSDPDHKGGSAANLPVGTCAWYGRIHGNHHLGKGRARIVQVLKGCNCAYRGDFLRESGFDRNLRGRGAQVGWEISLAFDAMAAKGTLMYDPETVVDHHIAPRNDNDTIHRGGYDRDAAYDVAWNYFSIVIRKAPRGLKWRICLWELVVGSRTVPGILRAGDLRVGPMTERWRRIRLTFRAFKDAYGATKAEANAPSANLNKTARFP